MNLILLIIIWLAAYAVSKWLTKRLPATKPGILGEHIIEITPDGLRENTAVNEGFHKWIGFSNIASNKDYIFFFTDNMAAHIVPKRAFKRQEELVQFLTTSENYWKESKQR